jgi:hypothetical protein
LLRLGDFGATLTRPVTTTADNFQAELPHQRFVVMADRNVHLKRTDQSSDDATISDFLLSEGVYAEVIVPPDAYLSFVLATGETDGTIRITPTS